MENIFKKETASSAGGEADRNDIHFYVTCLFTLFHSFPHSLHFSRNPNDNITTFFHSSALSVT